MYIDIYIIYTPNLGSGIAYFVREKEQGRFRKNKGTRPNRICLRTGSGLPVVVLKACRLVLTRCGFISFVLCQVLTLELYNSGIRSNLTKRDLIWWLADEK